MPITGGKTIKVFHDGKNVSKSFRFIDFKNPENNEFHVAVEYPAMGKEGIRPDIVCFVNGIPFAIIENKKSSVEVEDAINQQNRNQGADKCPKLFVYPQLLVGTNGKEMKYGTTGTPTKFYATWKEKGINKEEIEKQIQVLISNKIDDDVYKQICEDLNGATIGHKQVLKRLATEQDRGVAFLFEPTRILDLAKNYILYDAGIKKIMRYQQYFAIRKMLDRIEEETDGLDGKKRKGGLVWHTQGSGKSLTMVMFVKALIENPHIINPRIIILTDRKDLDKQISGTFKNSGLKKNVVRATSGQNLLDLIKEKDLSVITTLVQKFEPASKKKDGFVDKDKNIFVLVDEAHRTQSGIANLEMNRLMPNACYIGFTGTPLLKTDRESWKKFGGYIDKYTIDDALNDGIILPLIYEGRYVDLVENKVQIDRRVKQLTKNLSDEHKKDLQRFVSAKIIKDNPQRVADIAYDIENHYIEQFQRTGLKAQIVAPSKFAAISFQKYFEASGNIQTAVIISGESGIVHEDDEHKKEVIEHLDKIKERHKSLESYEKDAIDSFKNNIDGVEMIIVVDKLLTGFDAPRNTVMYLVKDLRDHNLLQAIARVNRLFDNEALPKTAGYIIDYSENAKNLDIAMKLFGNYDEDDVKGTLVDVSEKINDLEQSYANVHDIFKTIKNKSDDEEYIQYLGGKNKDDGDQKRKIFYEALNEFLRNFNECLVLQEFAQEFDHIDSYKNEIKKLMELRRAVSLQYADRVDFGHYKRALVNILDRFVDAQGVELLTKQINITDTKQFEEAIETLGSDRSKAEAIAAQTNKTILEKVGTDPEFYQRFSDKISDILKQMRDGKLADLEALKQMKDVSKKVVNKKDDTTPILLKNKIGADIFYRNLQGKFSTKKIDSSSYLKIISDMYDILHEEGIVDWYKNIEVKRVMINKIDDYLYDVVKGEMGIDLSSEEMKEIIEITMQLAENNNDIFKL
jgi:type I restriction enzyme R subunit